MLMKGGNVKICLNSNYTALNTIISPNKLLMRSLWISVPIAPQLPTTGGKLHREEDYDCLFSADEITDTESSTVCISSLSSEKSSSLHCTVKT